MVESIAGVVPDINNVKRIDDFCKKVYLTIKDNQNLEKYLKDSIDLFDRIKENWIKDKGSKFKYSIKDHPDFTKYMLTYIRGGNTDKIVSNTSDTSLRGRVVTVKNDRNGLSYGYIKHSPADVFIHEDDNPHIRFYDLKGKDVVYTIIASTKYNTERGKIKYVIKEA